FISRRKYVRAAGVDAPGYRCIREIVERAFEHTPAAKPFGCVGKNLGATLPANSDYPDHRRRNFGTPCLYSVKFCHMLRGHEFYEFKSETRITRINTNRLIPSEVRGNSCDSCLIE